MAKGLTVEFNIGEGQNEAFEAFMATATAKVKAEDAGCNNYDLFRSVDDDTRYLLFENWATQEDLEAHGTSEAMAGMAGIRQFTTGRPVLHRYEVED